VAAAAPAAADDSKLAREGVAPSPRAPARPRDKRCCGYPLVPELGFKLRFYWLAYQADHLDEYDEVEIYTPGGFYLGSFPFRFVRALRMEGSGVLADGRIVNYAGRCRYGVGTCFEQLDPDEYPMGRGANRRTLVPFHSVAVDPRVVALGEPLYVPELDGLRMPDGEVHDGCVRADDTGGHIKEQKMDFFVVTYANFRTLLDDLHGVIFVTPHIEDPRCQYLRDP
jgi:3D domain